MSFGTWRFESSQPHREGHLHAGPIVRSALALRASGLSVSETARRLDIPRPTVHDWVAGRLPFSARPSADSACPACGADQHRFAALSSTYVYLLGMYLGDGCISAHPRGVYKLRICLDARYPGIIAECSAAIGEARPGNRVGRHRLRSWFEVYSYSKSWPCLLPQHGPGKKHLRSIALEPWQSELVVDRPGHLLRGLIHSDGCRFLNTGRGNWVCPRYSFSNRSSDIRDIFCLACDALGVRWTRAPHTVYVSRKADVAVLDRYVGPKS